MGEMKTITVELKERSYPVYLQRGGLRELGRLYLEHGLGGRAAIITDRTVEKLYGPLALKGLKEAGVDAQLIPVPAGESSKSLEWADRLYTRLIWGGFDRDCTVVALGGGVVGDLAGFVAATFLRGIRWVQVPTTLLAQVDAAIGGKTGINHRLGKNLIGAFHQPQFVLIDPQLLESLPERERWSGLAEVVKYGLIRDERLFERLETQLEALARLEDVKALEGVIARAVEIKAEIVSEDERERGIRALLNFGHTVGHALEAASRYQRFLHGEAVAWGMRAEAWLSQKRGGLSPQEFERVLKLLRRFPQGERPEGLDKETLMEYIYRDKKARRRTLYLVLLRGLGGAELVAVGEDEVRQALEFLVS